jgi:putative flavoprotein involved in K+ transport
MELDKKHWDIVVIGGGQSGLAAGYYLKKMKKEFIIFDDNEKTGDQWRQRWDSLKLFTPSQHDNLPGMQFDLPKNSYPSKNQMAGFLGEYVEKYNLPVITNVKVNSLVSRDNLFEIDSSAGRLTADKVIVATGTHPLPKIPSVSSGLSKNIYQIHSFAYKNPESLPEGDVLVVGAGVSGIEIAVEISATHTTYISGKPNFHIPEILFKYAGKFFWWFLSNVLTINTPIGKKAKNKILHGGGPLISVSADDLTNAGVVSLPRVTGVKDGYPQLADGSVLKVSSIIWATGYKPDFSWIKMDITNGTGWPINKRGVSTTTPGLYFVGIPFQFGLTSGLVGGVGRDAKYISQQIFRN